MDLRDISLEPLRSHTVAILGYGNQGRAHALNLRDSGISVVVGAREGGAGERQAREDGFEPLPLQDAAARGSLVMFLLPDQIIPAAYAELKDQVVGKAIGFCHGFAYQYGNLERHADCRYFLVGPKGAGAILRARYQSKEGLPGVFALGANASDETRALCLAYAKAIGCATTVLLETTFQEETECDLFGEQAVLCGGILQLMESAFETLVKHGHSKEMAFFETCFEARLILELWMKYGPAGLSERISPTAFYGGLTRGARLVTDETKAELERIFGEIRSGAFAREWMSEVEKGRPQSNAERDRLKGSKLQAAYDELGPKVR